MTIVLTEPRAVCKLCNEIACKHIGYLKRNDGHKRPERTRTVIRSSLTENQR